MKLIEEQGDLFDLPTKYALAHCISLDCAMDNDIHNFLCLPIK